MSVVNVKVNSIRPRYNNLKEWMADPNNVYIGRRGIVFVDGQRFPKVDSIWHNPFKINETAGFDRNSVLIQYEHYIRDLLNNNIISILSLLQLKGKHLGCWCAPEPCHGHILLKLIDEYSDLGFNVNN